MEKCVFTAEKGVCSDSEAFTRCSFLALATGCGRSESAVPAGLQSSLLCTYHKSPTTSRQVTTLTPACISTRLIPGTEGKHAKERCWQNSQLSTEVVCGLGWLLAACISKFNRKYYSPATSFLFISVFCLNTLCVVFYTYYSVPSEAREGMGPRGLELQMVLSYRVCWELNSGCLQEQLVLLATEPSLFSVFPF